MEDNIQSRRVLEHQIGECKYDIDGENVLCRILRKGYAIAGSDGMGGVFVSEEVPSMPYDFRFPMAVHEYEENYTFWVMNPSKRHPDDNDEAHAFAIQREIEAAESVGQDFLRNYLDFMLDIYDRYIIQAELMGNPTEREKAFRKIYASKMSKSVVQENFALE